ncbi:hypothetical protein Cgig2_012931 [Carnegiea gigantea]|uniref:Mitochondrial import inner membrane translocase subunit TIM50 n=1 Tax=Carnegiea gigantea TaxID=171969 RepID=A0A9Q1GKQ9_9CARY|nr:hypothetical protein Cgig2_012931 [Carnegiea gigantea]
MGSKSKSFLSDEDKHSAGEEEEEESSSLGRALEKLNLGPKKQNKKLLLILSLNGFLIHRAHRADSAKIPRNRRPDGVYDGTRYVYRRPFLEQFIQFCLERFEAALWSSALERNIDVVLGCFFTRLKKRFLFIWDQNKCSDYGFKTRENKKKPLFFKELNKIWSSSTIGPRFFESNILLIVDEPYKALLNPQVYYIHIQGVISERIITPKGTTILNKWDHVRFMRHLNATDLKL